MNCGWFESRLDELLDQRLSPEGDEQLNDHAQMCPACARLLADHLALLDAMQLIAWPAASEKLPGRVLAEISSKPIVASLQALAASSASAPAAADSASHDRRSWRRAAGLASAVAAALLVGVGTAIWCSGHGVAHMPSSAPRASEQVSPIAAQSPDLPTIDAPAAIVAIEKDGASRPRSHGPLAMLSVEEVQSFLLGAHSPMMMMEQMSDGLKPVTHSMSAALHALRRTLPGEAAAARSS